MLTTLKKAWGKVNEEGDDAISLFMHGMTREQLSQVREAASDIHENNKKITELLKVAGCVAHDLSNDFHEYAQRCPLAQRTRVEQGLFDEISRLTQTAVGNSKMKKGRKKDSPVVGRKKQRLEGKNEGRILSPPATIR